MNKYHCVVNRADTIIAYETAEEVDGEILFALVAENLNQGLKVSALLKKEDAILLRDQLNEFIED